MLYEIFLIAVGAFIGQEYKALPSIKLVATKTMEILYVEIEKCKTDKLKN